MRREKVIVVGAGIVGLAHAWSAAERGHEVTVIERSPRASGASIRNFGMIWVIGQSDALRPLALTSRERWMRLAREAGIWVSPCGSLHMAHQEDEWRVLQEYAEIHRSGPRGGSLRLLTPSETLERSPAANPTGLMGSLWSDTECCVDPPSAVRSLPTWLNQQYGVEFQFRCAAVNAQPGELTTSDGKRHRADRILVCSGEDMVTLFPELYASQAIRGCKLHMMRTIAQSGEWRIGPHLAGGLTLRHYPNFRVCSSLQSLIDRIASESPELDAYGIHVMASQNQHGNVVFGDSHEYDDAIEPFDNSEIDRLILRELQRIIVLSSWEIESRWHGIYAKYLHGPAFEHCVAPGVYTCTGVGGNGMTLSFGLAERAWNQWQSEFTEAGSVAI